MDATFDLAGPVDLRTTLGRLDVLPGTARYVGANEAWRTMRTADGPATVRLQATPGDDGSTVAATAWGPGAAAALRAVPSLLGVSDTPDVLAPRHRIISELQRRFRGLRLGSTGLVFEALVPTILGQKVAGKEAARSWQRLLAVHGEEAPGPMSLRVAPAASVLGSLPYEAYHPLGVERRRARTIIESSRHLARLEALVGHGFAAARSTLEALPGVGPWTSAVVVSTAMGDPDAVPVGDYHLPNTVAWALAGETRASDDRMLELLEPYRGQRMRVLTLLAAGGVHAPRFGPRRALRSIERI